MDRNINIKKSLINNQQGQAVFELIIFLPFLIFLFMIYSTTGNSISGSINQQKAVRAYFYGTTKGNSYINTRLDLKFLSNKGRKTVGYSALGWREHSEGDESTAFAPCFQFTSVLKNDSQEKCDDSARDTEDSSRFIRVFTYYGVCGPVYVVNTDDPNGEFYEIPPNVQSNPQFCFMSDGPPS
ncbi:MAG: hypothetical protein H7177_18150 [Rhizobacter sp.]|nr:hypothetical protein [Bacteriovorax sp.]